ncbi:MAG: tetratricopeptide repeat protein [Planctomycetaceae bacterium]
MSKRQVTAIVTLAGLMDLCLAGGCHLPDRVRHRADCDAGYARVSELAPAAPIADANTMPPADEPISAPALPSDEMPEVVDDLAPSKVDAPAETPDRDPIVVDKPEEIELKSPSDLELEKAGPKVSKTEEPMPEEPQLESVPQKPAETSTEAPEVAEKNFSKEGIAALKKAGAVIKFDKSWDPFNDSESPETVIGVDLSNAQFGDSDIEHLSGMKNLRELDLSGTQIGDASIESIIELGSLELLWLNGTKISDEGLKELTRLSGLKSLGLANTSIGNNGIRHLAALKNMEYLLLAHSRVTDNGLEHIRGLSQLKGLSLMGTEVTEDGVKKLREALPNCQVVLDPKIEQGAGALKFFRKRPFVKLPQIMAATRVTRESKTLPIPQPHAVHGGFNTTESIDGGSLTANLQNARSLHAEGQTLAAVERWSEAAEILAKAVKLAPEDTHIHYHLAVALARSGNAEGALPHFLRSVGEAEAHYNLGVILYEEGKLEASELQLVQALRLNPRLDVAQQQLDDVRLELKATRSVGRVTIRSASR